MGQLILTPAVSADDGFWAPGDSPFNNSSTSLTAGNVASAGSISENSFMRFTPLTLGQGTQITAASLAIYASTNTLPTLRVYGEKALNPTAVTSAANGDSRTLTTAFTSWSPSGTGPLTVDVTAIIQELVNQSGWVPTNAVQLFVNDNSSTTNLLIIFRSMSFAGGMVPPTLTVTFALSSIPTHMRHSRPDDGPAILPSSRLPLPPHRRSTL